MKILGVDPGTRFVGAGLITAAGSQCKLHHFEIIHIRSKLSIAARLLKIHQALSAVIREFRPGVMALENIFFGQNVSTLVKIGESRACAMLAAAENGIEVVEYPPARVKEAVSGNGRASKEQIQWMIQKLLAMDSPPPADGADALAVAICHWHCSERMDRRFKRKKTRTWELVLATQGTRQA